MDSPASLLGWGCPVLPFGLVLTADLSHACDSQGLGLQRSSHLKAVKGGDCLELPLAFGTLGGACLPLSQDRVLLPLPAEDGARTGWKGQDGQPVDLLLAVCGLLLQHHDRAQVTPTAPSHTSTDKNWGPEQRRGLYPVTL